jgi:putative spermidine/putrescine transport system substrate-binding protein
MPSFTLNRRRLIQLAGATSAGLMIPGMAQAQNGRVIAAVFPGSWEDAYRTVLPPILSEQGVDLTVAPMLAQDQLARLMATPDNPPFDTLLMSPGQSAVAIENELIVPIDPSRLANWDLLDPSFQDPYGPIVTVEVNGIAYNPDLVPEPTGYADLFENEVYSGLVSWTGFGSNTAVMAYSQLASIYGSGPEDMQAVLDLFAGRPDHLAGVVDSTNTQISLYQQGEVAVFMASTGNIARLRGLGLSAEFAQPETGSPAAPVAIHLASNAANPDAAYAFMDAAISAAAQSQLSEQPYGIFPTNSDVELTPEIEEFVTRDMLGNLVYPDWAFINENRAEWIRTFDSIVAG